MYILQNKKDSIERYIYALTLWTTICYFTTQILSKFQAITPKNLWLTWGIIDVLLILILWSTKRYILVGKNSIESVISFVRKRILWFLFALVIVMIAVKTVPYNWDSMTYHMARVAHWFENQSIEHYATHINRQIGSPTLGAYINLHVYTMLGGRDRLVNLPQCIAFLTNGIFVYGLAQKIGCIKKYCTMAMVLFYTMPIAFAEAFTTQVDNISTIWLLSFVYLLLDLLKLEEKLLLNKYMIGKVILLSLCIGYGILTKPSVGFGFFIFCIWLLLVVIRRKDKIKAVLTYITMAVCILLAVFSLDFGRNIKTFDALLPSNVGQKQLVGTIRPHYLLVNGIKTFSFNLPSVWIYDSSDIILNVNSKIAEVLHVDIDDEAISEGGREYSVNNAKDYGHDTAVNPVVVILFLFSIYSYIRVNRKQGLYEVRNTFWLASAASFLIFCTLLRWEPFVSRYMISYLSLVCVAVCGQMQMFFEENECIGKDKAGYFAFLLYFLSITEGLGLFMYHGDIALNSSRYSGYFMNRKDIESDYREVVNAIDEKEYDSLGLILGADVYEYPLLVMLEDDMPIHHVNVANSTNQYEDNAFVPEAILVLEYGEVDAIECHGARYQLVKNWGTDKYLLEKID